MTIQDMDICLNVSSGPAAGATKKIRRSKTAFFKPHVKKQIAKNLKHADNEKTNNATEKTSLSKISSSIAKTSTKNIRVKQKSLAAIVAKNIARSKTVTFHKNTKAIEEQREINENGTKLYEASKQKNSLVEGTNEPTVSFSEPKRQNTLRTIFAKTKRIDESKPKKSLADVFSVKSSSSESTIELLRACEKREPEEAGLSDKGEKFPHARNVITAESGSERFGGRAGVKRNRNWGDANSSRSEPERDKLNRSKPSGKISSLFGNNPEVPNIGQRLVKPVNESVFSESMFQELGIHEYAVSNLRQNMGITKITTVQKKAIPVILSGRNVLVRSQTGSGKTLSYALPIVEALHEIRPKLMRNSGLRALVVVPTRELALQTYECFTKLVKPFTWIVPGYLVGGEKRKAEKARLRRGCTILVATPGRLLDHIEHTEALKLSQVRFFVLDEADRMLDMGYEKDISGIVEALKRQSGIEVERSSYDPLALIRNNGRKIVDEGAENDEEKLFSKRKEFEGKNSFGEVDDESEILKKDRETSSEPEYHSGTESDEDDQELLVRTKKIKKSQARPSKPTSDKVSREGINENEEGTDGALNSSRQTILLSATLTAAVEKLAGLTMTNPVLVDAAQENLDDVGGHSSEINEDLVVPQGVTQSYIVTPAKLRMVTLSAYIAGKCQIAGQHKILVFMATQDMIDYYADILSTVLGKPSADDDDDSDPLVDVEFFKLHGSMSQKERTEVFKTFRKARSGVLLCTDVASRGLDLPKVDTVVQYTGPLSARDYVHRIGRTARAGTSGVSTIFLTPSEIDFVRMLESRRIRIKQENMNDVLDKLMGPLSKHRTVEATATALQNEFETLVLENKKFHSKACKAYVSWIRFYSSYPRDMREIFNRKELHLGHYAKSFALRDPPQRIGGIGKTLRDQEPSKSQHNNRLSNERPARQPQKRQCGPGSGQRPGFLKKSRMLNTSEYGSGLEPIKKTKKSQ